MTFWYEITGQESLSSHYISEYCRTLALKWCKSPKHLNYFPQNLKLYKNHVYIKMEILWQDKNAKTAIFKNQSLFLVEREGRTPHPPRGEMNRNRGFGALNSAWEPCARSLLTNYYSIIRIRRTRMLTPSHNTACGSPVGSYKPRHRPFGLHFSLLLDLASISLI